MKQESRQRGQNGEGPECTWCVQGEGKPSVTGMLRMWGREVGDEAGKVGRSR